MRNIVKRMGMMTGLCSSMFLTVQADPPIKENFEKQVKLDVIGRGMTKIENGVFKSRDAYARFGKQDLKDFRATFRARAHKDADQVQIWAGFRANNRFDRYIVGFMGGLQNDLYLSRMGYMGTDELLGITSLDFKPEVGEWYTFKIEVVGDRIRIFVNDEQLPRIDVIDKNSQLAPSGYLTLGGGWIETEFDDLLIEPLAPNTLQGVPSTVYTVKVDPEEKETQRQTERAAYVSKKMEKLRSQRTEISLDGNWLFMPDYQVADKELLADPAVSDHDWHVMRVPNFWNPIRIWLHGETMGPFPKGVSDTYYQQETDRCAGYTFDYKKTKAAAYRQWIELPEGIQHKTSELILDAVSKMADVYVNGTLVTSHVGMFGEIRKDISKFLKPGKNLITVYVTRDYIKDIERADEIVDVAVTVPVTNKMLKDIAHGFYGDDPAGIWQPVKLIVSNPVKVEDVFIRPTLTGATFDVTIKNHSKTPVQFDLATDIVEEATGNLFYREASLKGIRLNGDEEKIVTYGVHDLKPRLWSPQDPNLYNFHFKINTPDGELKDEKMEVSGFRTFESKNGLLHLNGKPYWLRGGNHTPFALAPNDSVLANSFYQIMKAGNIEVTRTHTTPYNKLWIEAADKNGIGISHEGTWPWLMIQGSMPDKALIDMWAEEYLGLLKKYRNHPAILFWTINNEMKFYDNDPDMERRKEKMKIISDVVKKMRAIDPTRPICFDSNYRRREDIFGKDFYNDIDDGDIDDVHAYINWYDYTIFKQFNGEFQERNRNEGRPLISQEMSTGYPNNETGHPTRSYMLIHQNPQSLVGYASYPYADPASFLKVQSFITGELAEALRRSNDKTSGILHFALLTWFRNVYNPQTIEPYPTYYAVKRALQPVLASAELWGRNFFAGTSLPARFCIVNDLENGRDLKPGVLNWWLETEDGKRITAGALEVPGVEHYKRVWVTPAIQIPGSLPSSKLKAKLKLRYTEDGKEMSTNVYEVLLAEKNWTNTVNADKKIIIVDGADNLGVFDFLQAKYTKANTIREALAAKADLIILSAISKDTSTDDLKSVRNYIAKGGKVLILNSEEATKGVFPEYITGWVKPSEGEIVSMEIPESPVFDDIDLLELRYFNNNKPELPTVCDNVFQVVRDEQVMELASLVKIHGYIEDEMEQRSEKMKTLKGYPLLKIVDGKGHAIVSSMSHRKTSTDPVAAKLLANMINASLKNE
ncbi:glycoside hydrolase family 2 TIM barrel-domain containing protein [Sphingobacterium corticibacterium]|uniref:beta-galactosidase n=1 Tax=Sphingobacterium corticibacterium TaxID=2484746 RepID=A0A4Q6XQC2_9SPHI|nr:glycoside hydrolase family 2 TIM barrel-domain containing protein [Sphingobacterium corticibacterium]RZF62141.1 glycoside hydrolase family 2 [Sphingobacterium corticibacterium]